MPLPDRSSAGSVSPIAQRRRALNLGQEELASRCGLSRPFISLLESGRTQPNVQVALRVAAVLGASVEELFGATEEPPPSGLPVRLAVPDLSEGTRVDIARVGNRWVAHPTDTTASLGGGFADADGVTHLSKGTLQALTHRARSELEANIAIAGCDPALALLRNVSPSPGVSGRCFWVNCGSARALKLLADGWVHAAGLHYTGSDHEQNLRQVRALDPHGRWAVFRFTQWEQGWMVRRSTRDAFKVAADFASGRFRLANRETGSGSRSWIDEQIKVAGLSGKSVPGYDAIFASHWECARALAEDKADIASGPRAIASVFGLNFVPVTAVAFDLVVPKQLLDHPRLQILFNRIRSRGFQREIEAIPGYEARQAGENL